MATSYLPIGLSDQIGTSGSPVPIVSPGATEIWCVHRLTLTSITGVPVSVIVTDDALEYASFDIPGNGRVELGWGGPGHIVNPSSTLNVEVDTVDVINYKVDGVLGTVAP